MYTLWVIYVLYKVFFSFIEVVANKSRLLKSFSRDDYPGKKKKEKIIKKRPTRQLHVR